MTTGELAYLVMVIAAMLVFVATLAWVSAPAEAVAPDTEEHVMEFGIQFFPDVSPDQKSAADYFAEPLKVGDEPLFERTGWLRPVPGMG